VAKDETYTKPGLRKRLKEQVQAGDKGGKPGQWSARKAQLLVREYEKAGGGYVDDGKRTGAQQHLAQWGEQDWGTKGGKGGARYLPEVAWKLLSKAEREATEGKKKKGDGQFVANTAAAKEARRAAELLTLKAPEARKAVRKMDGRSQLRRARKAEKTHGKGRTTVLAAIEDRLREL
jgi:hypothetical protein